MTLLDALEKLESYVITLKECGAGAPGRQGFQPNNTCARGRGTGGVLESSGQTLHQAKQDSKGNWVTAKGPIPDHVKKAGIKKGWNDVYVNLDPKGDLIINALDSKGRLQMSYSKSHNAKSSAAKFGRTRELMKQKQKIYTELRKDAKNPRWADRAECLELVMRTGMRPGSNKDTKAEHKSYGASTIEGRHVIKKSDGSVSIKCVTGKNKGKEVEFEIHDDHLAKRLIARKKAAGDNGKIFQTSTNRLRLYSKTKDGKGFQTKDHRTAVGTETAMYWIKKLGAPKTEADYKSKVAEVSRKVASTLGNTPRVALSHYIDPLVFTVWKKSAGVNNG